MSPWQQAWDAQFDPATSHPDRPNRESVSSHPAVTVGATSNTDLPPVGVHPQDVPPAVLGATRIATPAAAATASDATPVELVGAPHADQLPADTYAAGGYIPPPQMVWIIGEEIRPLP